MQPLAFAIQREYQVGVEHFRRERRPVELFRRPGFEKAAEGNQPVIIRTRNQSEVGSLKCSMLFGRAAAHDGTTEDIGGFVPKQIRNDRRGPLFLLCYRHFEQPWNKSIAA